MPGVELIRRRLVQLEERINALSLKERLLLMGALLLVLTYAWQVRVLAPLELKRKALTQEVSGLNRTLQELDAQTTEWTQAAAVDPDAATRQRLVELARELASVKTAVEARTGRMVSPEQMPLVLKNLLAGFKDLNFEAMEGLAVQPVLEDPAPIATGTASPPGAVVVAKAPPGQAAYKHGIRIRFSGSYRAATAYLKALEALPYGFFWDHVELDATDFPRVRGALVVYTVSLRAGWIGV